MPFSTSLQRKRGSSFVIDYQPRPRSLKKQFFSERSLSPSKSPGCILATSTASAVEKSREEAEDLRDEAAAKHELLSSVSASSFPALHKNSNAEEMMDVIGKRSFRCSYGLNLRSKDTSSEAFSLVSSPSQTSIHSPSSPFFSDIGLEERRCNLRRSVRIRDHRYVVDNHCSSGVSFFSPSHPLIPPKAAHLKDKLTVVLDLDETLVYARAGPLYVRPGIEALLSFLRVNCETIVWTAGIHRYADAVVAEIDKHCVVSHTISRNSAWQHHGKKDVKLLRRDLDRLVLIDNTPDAIRGNEENSVLVEDYEGGELEDTTLYALVNLLQDLTDRIREDPDITVPQYMKQSLRVIHRSVPTDSGELMECPCLAPDYAISSCSFLSSSHMFL